jgi:ABC-type transport system substrate-binding protein
MTTPNFMRAAVLSLSLLVFGCGKPQPLGDRNAVILGVADAEWPALEQRAQEVLEPTAFAVYDERIFRVTQVDPAGPYWGDTRRFRNLVVVGEPADPWIAEALRRANTQPSSYPALVETTDVWARGQRVYTVVLAPGAQTATAEPLLADIASRMLERYQREVHARMFASGVDTLRVAEVAREAGFRLTVPNVYRLERIDDATIRFINDQPDPARLQRSVLVTSEPPASATAPTEDLLDWRDEIAGRYYDPGQTTLRERVETVALGNGQSATSQIQGTWASVPGAWPAGGPFLTRSVRCADGRTFLLDAWLYAPGRDKYEYMFQLNTILDSFSCA